MFVLPAEVLDHIFSFLHSDKAALEACSRSHPTLSPLVERHLYSTVIVRDHGRHEIFTVLRDRPNIANYIQALEIMFRSDDVDYLEDLSPILPKLLMLRSIKLHCTRGDKCQWQALPESFRLAFLDCLRLSSMTSITTIFIAFPLSILSHCNHIRQLSLQFWTNGETPMAEGDSVRLPTIDSLILRDCWWSLFPSSVSVINRWMKSCHLSSLEFSDCRQRVPSNFNSLPLILISCSHSLTSLDVDIDTWYGNMYGSDGIDIHPNEVIPIPLSNLRNLKRLTIHARFYPRFVDAYRWKLSSPIFAITDVLKSAFALPLLILSLKAQVEFDDYNEAQAHITDILCGPLHSLLVQSASTIDSIHLRFTSESIRSPISSNDIIAILAGHSGLTQFVESGKLILTPMV